MLPHSAFCTRSKLFRFARIQFGLSDAPGFLCKIMPIVFSDLLWVVCPCCLNDTSLNRAGAGEQLAANVITVLDTEWCGGRKATPTVLL